MARLTADRRERTAKGTGEAVFPASLPVFLAVLWALALAGCATAPAVDQSPPVIYPLPPAKARVLYLGAVSSPADLPSRRSKLAEFVLGPEPIFYPLLKPINAVLSGSRLYVCDTILNAILVYDTETGEAHALAGDRAAGKILQPNNVLVDDRGYIFVADRLRRAVLVYGPDEKFLDAWGRIDEVTPVAIEADDEHLYVCDIEDHEIEVWDRSDGTYIRTIGKLGREPGEFFMPTYMARDDSGHLYVTDTGNARVQKLTTDGVPVQVYGSHGTSLGQFAWPKGVGVDGDERVYVADSRFANVQIFSPEGQLLLFFGGPGRDRGNLDLPAGVRVYPWPENEWFSSRLIDGFDPEYLVLVVNQRGEGYLNFFAIAREEEAEP